jgi:hypothetical protein
MVLIILGALFVVVIGICIVADAFSRKRHNGNVISGDWADENAQKLYTADLKALRATPPRSWNHGVDPPPPPAAR